MRTSYSNLADAWITVALNQIAPEDEAEKPVSGHVFSDSDKKLIVNSKLEQCDAADGLKDGMILDSRACHFNPSELPCKGAKAEGCLTSAKVNAIQKGFAGPKNARGKLVYPGFPFDTGIGASGQGVIPGLLNPGPSPVGGPNLSLEIDLDEAVAAIAAKLAHRPDGYDFDRFEYLCRAWRKADLLPWPERSVVLTARYPGVLREAGQSIRMESPVFRPRHGSLSGRHGDSGSF